jgi:hypothetical protein
MTPTYIRKAGVTAHPISYPPTYQDGTPVNFAGATLTYVQAARYTGVVVVNAEATITGDNVFEFEPTAEQVPAGEYLTEWHVLYADGSTEVWPDEGYFLLRIEPTLDDLPTP